MYSTQSIESTGSTENVNFAQLGVVIEKISVTREYYYNIYKKEVQLQ